MPENESKHPVLVCNTLNKSWNTIGVLQDDIHDLLWCKSNYFVPHSITYLDVPMYVGNRVDQVIEEIKARAFI